jgi:hypothetical protein
VAAIFGRPFSMSIKARFKPESISTTTAASITPAAARITSSAAITSTATSSAVMGVGVMGMRWIVAGVVVIAGVHSSGMMVMPTTIAAVIVHKPPARFRARCR